MKKYKSKNELQIDEISMNFLQSDFGPHLPAIRPLSQKYMPAQLQEIKTEEISVKNAENRTYKGFITSRNLSYEEAEEFCKSKEAKMPWFEMVQSGLKGPVWIRYDFFYLFLRTPTTIIAKISDFGSVIRAKSRKDYENFFRSSADFITRDINASNEIG